MVLFVVLAMVVNLTASFVSRRHFGGEARHLVPCAACLDMTVVVPALYYILVVRRGVQGLTSLFLLVLVCFVRALFVFPAIFPAGISREAVLIGAELGVMGLVGLRVRQGMRAAATGEVSRDPLQQIAAACEAIVPLDVVARFLGSELAILYYALFSWRSRADRQEGKAFTTHKKGGSAILLGVLACFLLIEAPMVHVVVARWSRPAAWILTALGMYGFVWILGLARSLVLRPVVVTEGGLEMSKGFLWHVRVPWSEVVAVKRVGLTASVSGPEFLNLAMGSACDFVVELAGPAVAQGPFGMSRRVRRIGLSIDEGREFEGCLR